MRLHQQCRMHIGATAAEGGQQGGAGDHRVNADNREPHHQDRRGDQRQPAGKLSRIDAGDKAGKAIILRGEEGNQHRRRDHNQIVGRAVHGVSRLGEDQPCLVSVPEQLQRHQKRHHHHDCGQRRQAEQQGHGKDAGKDNGQTRGHRPETGERLAKLDRTKPAGQDQQGHNCEESSRDRADRDRHPGIDRVDKCLADGKGDEKWRPGRRRYHAADHRLGRGAPPRFRRVGRQHRR